MKFYVKWFCLKTSLRKDKKFLNNCKIFGFWKNLLWIKLCLNIVLLSLLSFFIMSRVNGGVVSMTPKKLSSFVNCSENILMIAIRKSRRANLIQKKNNEHRRFNNLFNAYKITPTPHNTPYTPNPPPPKKKSSLQQWYKDEL